MVEEDIAKEWAKYEDKGKRENRQAAADRVNTKRYLPPPFSMGKMFEKEFYKSCNYPVFLLPDTPIICYL